MTNYLDQECLESFQVSETNDNDNESFHNYSYLGFLIEEDIDISESSKMNEEPIFPEEVLKASFIPECAYSKAQTAPSVPSFIVSEEKKPRDQAKNRKKINRQKDIDNLQKAALCGILTHSVFLSNAFIKLYIGDDKLYFKGVKTFEDKCLTKDKFYQYLNKPIRYYLNLKPKRSTINSNHNSVVLNAVLNSNESSSQFFNEFFQKSLKQIAEEYFCKYLTKKNFEEKFQISLAEKDFDGLLFLNDFLEKVKKQGLKKGFETKDLYMRKLIKDRILQATCFFTSA